ncbi:hypothetical protein NEF87_004066 [Candidatus Lokiarchaeum ossiferum]|uniref:Phosphate-specific transport system accessory protein PhoU n=1 Tax=Candidatus Lokiarchaeum ossiferum TaxID=2951803 RepID=A0ABY6HWM3_9ARCH|nr:hypothetical protein NEF87_004066 [Candidatus Lokiarchaeum sp. B-35]
MQRFHNELTLLKQKLLKMGELALFMLNGSIEALKRIDISLANKIHEERLELNQYDIEIENEALRLIALYQPMANDIRTLACILKTNTYLNRIGRYGKDIAKITWEFENHPHFKKLVSIPQMGRLVEEMVKDALKAFEEGDLKYLENFTERDDELDELRYSIFRECVSYMMENPRIITQGSHYIMVARYLERCGDHACKIAEKIHYMVDGSSIEIK